MIFSREMILALDNEQLSEEDKRHLIGKFFPAEPYPEWKKSLRVQWIDGKRWRRFEGLEIGEPGHAPYRFTHESLCEIARLRPPARIGHTVSDFTSWVYSLYRPPPKQHSLADGLRVERQVARLAPWPKNKGWECIYEDPLSEQGEPKTISALKVSGVPLRGVPDVVFREKATGRIAIVERKASNKEIPADGWPNLRAQLWAYSYIDSWIDAPDVWLIGEVWGFDRNKVWPRAVRRWVRGDERFEKQNAELFSLYTGQDTQQ